MGFDQSRNVSSFQFYIWLQRNTGNMYEIYLCWMHDPMILSQDNTLLFFLRCCKLSQVQLFNIKRYKHETQGKLTILKHLRFNFSTLNDTNMQHKKSPSTSICYRP